MTKSMLAAALLLGAAIAAPAVVSAADQPQSGQSGPEEPGMGAGGMGPGGMGPMGDMGQQGPMGMHGHGWMHGMMQRMMQKSPQQRCEDRLARRAGIVAYVVTKLNLNAQQKQQWEKLRPILEANADRDRQLCESLKPRGHETMLDRLSRREQFLSTRLQDLQQAKPVMEQLYNSLTPEQKAIADHPFRQ